MNAFVHEKSHLDNPTLMKTPQGEINAIRTQVSDPSFSNTSSNFKGAIISYATQNLNLEIKGGTLLNVMGGIPNLNSIFSGYGNFELNTTPDFHVDSHILLYDDDDSTVTAPKIK